MKRLTWLAIVWTTIAWATTAAVAVAGAMDSVQLLPSPIVLPTRIGPMALTGAHSYKDPALGISYQYTGDGLSLTIFVYNGGDPDIPDGANTLPASREYEIAKQDVTQAYQNTQLKSEQLVRLSPPDELLLAREAVYEYDREQKPTISFIWITAAAKYFVKLRFSVDPRLRDELPEARRAMLTMVGDAIRPYLKPSDSNAAAPATAMGFNVGGNSSHTMTTTNVRPLPLEPLNP